MQKAHIILSGNERGDLYEEIIFEVDDLYAIARALIEPSWNIIALNAAQWQSSQWAVDAKMEERHRLNHVMVSYLRLYNELKTLRGGVHRMNDWGDKTQHSAAAYEIIKQAHHMGSRAHRSHDPHAMGGGKQGYCL